MTETFRLLMISAMYENGGNTTHRLLDGHPQMLVYPFESQVGTQLVRDNLSSMFPVKYRWPVFSLDATPREDYGAIIDEECRVRARTPHVSKFRHVKFQFSDDERGRLYVRYIERTGRSRGKNIEAFFRSTFDAWHNFPHTESQQLYVGYSPIIVVDGDKVLDDLPNAHVLHVVRNPWSAYADTKRRPVPLALRDYMLAWTTNQHHALIFRELYPERLHIIRAEDIMCDPHNVLSTVCQRLGIDASDTLRVPSWNGTPMEEVYPWGTIRTPTPERNRETALELSSHEREAIRLWAWQYLEAFDYKNFI